MADHSADSPDAERPEPVLDQARIVSTASGLLAAASTAAVVLGVLPQTDADAVTTATVAVVGAVITVINIAVPIWRAQIARRHVTPLASPRSASGEALVAASAIGAITTAEVGNGPLPEGEPEATPWGEETNVVEEAAA